MTKYIAAVRKQNPVVLTVANMVTPGDVANAVNAIGGSPIMSCAPEEAEEMTKIASAVTINAGTLTNYQKKEIKTVIQAAQRWHKPVVLDPVAVAMPYRHEFITQLLANHQVTIIRGNAGEIANLAGIKWQSKGIDAGNGNHDELIQIATQCAKKNHCTVMMTGAVDVITDGQQTAINHLGTPLFQTYVGCGDMISSITAAFLATGQDYFAETKAAVQSFTAAGQLAARNHQQPGSFFNTLLDQLYLLDDQTVAKMTSNN